MPAPENFSDRVKAIRAASGDVTDELRALAGHALNANQLLRLGKLVDKAAALQPFKLGIISNATTDFLTPAICGTGLRYGLAIECITADYGQFMQAALDPDSAVNTAGCDAILLALDAHAFALSTPPGDEGAAAQAVERALAMVESMRAGVAQSGAAIIVHTIAPPAETLLGGFDAVLAGSERSQIAAFNRILLERCHQSSSAMLDVAGMADTVGLANWHDPIAWNMAKQPVAHALIPYFADHLCRLIAAMRGKSRKALVLDLDNTVWAGVIGDDGMAGINIAQGDATGEAHLALQSYALALRERGVVLAVSSKNTDEIARQVFREHPDMLLREEHIAVFQANWNDKASNLEAIAKALNICLDALVFVDDNPAERALVRQRLPQVAVPELPEDPAFYVRTIAAAGYFEAVGFADEDRKRAQFYSDNAKRVALQANIGSIDDYLRSLEMRISFAAFDESGRARIAQLINKSNQFNLTTRRYSETDVDALISDPAVFTMQIRLEDVFGDNGMISTIICRLAGEDWLIDTWLMSCRVLGRKVEQAALQQLVRTGKARGIKRLVGIYRPTERNGIVADHYAKLGFTPSGQSADGDQWILSVDDAPIDNTNQIFAAISSQFSKDQSHESE
ncbi:HAD-IIIC family phosphatase [Sphingorhabdus sp.]|uniref:HAD-IIIC family phosphatase n=1 Tax=Sphingorhabdus sp. TaxID=1902408 RepID=UPI003C70FA65